MGNIAGLPSSFVKMFLNTPFGGGNDTLISLTTLSTSIPIFIQLTAHNLVNMQLEWVGNNCHIFATTVVVMDKQPHTIISIFKHDTTISISLGHAYKDLAGIILGLPSSFVKLFLHGPFWRWKRQVVFLGLTTDFYPPRNSIDGTQPSQSTVGMGRDNNATPLPLQLLPWVNNPTPLDTLEDGLFIGNLNDVCRSLCNGKSYLWEAYRSKHISMY